MHPSQNFFSGVSECLHSHVMSIVDGAHACFMRALVRGRDGTSHQGLDWVMMARSGPCAGSDTALVTEALMFQEANISGLF